MTEDVLDLDLDPRCPSCGHLGFEYDSEFKAWVHDLCGYWVDAEPEAEPADDWLL